MEIDLHEFVSKNKISESLHKKWKDEIFEEIIELLEKNPKYVLDHHNDPPYDCSGQLYLLSDYFIVSLYETVGDFLSEYNGTKLPTFTSGCGWRYLTLDEGLYGGSFIFDSIYIDYYINLLMEEYELEEDELNDYYSKFDEVLGDDNYKLSAEVLKANLFEVYQKYSKDKRLLDYDYFTLRKKMMKILEQCPPNSEVLLFCFLDSELAAQESFLLKHLQENKKEWFFPDSEKAIFHYVLNNAIHEGGLIVLTVKTKLDNSMIELRSMRLLGGTIEPLTTKELRQSYSSCADCGEPIEPPKEYIFCEFRASSRL